MEGATAELAAAYGWWRDGDGAVSITSAALDRTARLRLAHQVLMTGGEGVVIKQRASGYRAGRSTAWVKAKYTRMLYAVAGATSPRGQTSMLLHGPAGGLVTCGSATSFSRPPVPGSVVKVRYRLTPKGALREAVIIAADCAVAVVGCEMIQLDGWPHLSGTAVA